MNALHLIQSLEFAIKTNTPILIKGKPGIGKSDIVATAAQKANAQLIISHPVVSDPTDYKGLPFAGKDETAHFMPFGELRQLIDATEKTVYFLDDLGQAAPSVQAAAMQLILARRINGHKVSDSVVFIAATNNKADKAGVSGILEPVKSRFTILDLEVSSEDWQIWARDNNNIPLELIAFIRFRPELLHKFDPTKEIVNSPCPRNIAEVGKQQNSGLPSHLMFEFFSGRCGEAWAAEYKGFLDLFKELPSIDEIALNPKTAPISEKPGVHFALSGLIAKHMNEKNIDAFVTYLDRLPPDINVACMKDATARKRDLAMTKAYNSVWAPKFGNLYL